MDTDRQAAADTPPDPEPATPAYDEVLARGLACQLTSACNLLAVISLAPDPKRLKDISKNIVGVDQLRSLQKNLDDLLG
jgi:hypothetical protein